jgi:hypothetical protein
VIPDVRFANIAYGGEAIRIPEGRLEKPCCSVDSVAESLIRDISKPVSKIAGARDRRPYSSRVRVAETIDGRGEKASSRRISTVVSGHVHSNQHCVVSMPIFRTLKHLKAAAECLG